MKLEFSEHTSEKYLNIKLRENPSSESRAVPCTRTDMTKPNRCFPQFCERAYRKTIFHDTETDKNRIYSCFLLTYKHATGI